MNPFNWIAEYINKNKSHIYGIFAFWIAFLHLPIIFSALFIDQKLIYQQTNMLKDDYLRHAYFNDIEDILWEITRWLAAIILTYAMIWILPKRIINKAYSQELEDQYLREFMKVAKEEQLIERRKNLIQDQAKAVDEEERVISRQEKIENKELNAWDEEYEEFKTTSMFTSFYEIAESITRYNSEIQVWSERGKDFEIDEDLLAYAVGNNLLNLVGDNRDSIELTEKGKYFLKRYQMDRHKIQSTPA